VSTAGLLVSDPMLLECTGCERAGNVHSPVGQGLVGELGVWVWVRLHVWVRGMGALWTS
jgi:hypothetical protein